MRLLLATLLFGFSYAINAQNIPVNFNNCEYDHFSVTADNKPEWNNTDTTLVCYFNEKLGDYKKIRKTNGKIVLGILVYENGKTCCHSFTNMTNNKKIDPQIFKEVVNSMPNWKAGKQRGKPIIFLYHAILRIKKGRFVVMK